MAGEPDWFEKQNVVSFRDENELCKILEQISDKFMYKLYDEADCITLVNSILSINILALSYTAREQALYTLCEAVANYDISDKVDWKQIAEIRNDVEADLKEYIDDFWPDLNVRDE